MATITTKLTARVLQGAGSRCGSPVGRCASPVVLHGANPRTMATASSERAGSEGADGRRGSGGWEGAGSRRGSGAGEGAGERRGSGAALWGAVGLGLLGSGLAGSGLLAEEDQTRPASPVGRWVTWTVEATFGAANQQLFDLFLLEFAGA